MAESDTRADRSRSSDPDRATQIAALLDAEANRHARECAEEIRRAGTLTPRARQSARQWRALEDLAIAIRVGVAELQAGERR